MDSIDNLRTSSLAPLLDKRTGVLSRSEHLTIAEVPLFTLNQIAVWPERIDSVSRQFYARLGSGSPPRRWTSVFNDEQAVLWLEPLKFWQIGGEQPSMEAGDGAILDLSHSRTWVRISGKDSQSVLSANVPIDLRPGKFDVGAVASTIMHEVGITIWRSDQGYELFLPRSFSRALTEMLVGADAST